MSNLPNPALAAFIAEVGAEFVLAEVLLRRTESGHELRNVHDREIESTALQSVAIDDLRALAQTTSQGAFRPLKSAPTLRRGWKTQARGPEELERALNILY